MTDQPRKLRTPEMPLDCLERGTKIGWLSMAFSDRGVCAISISDAPDQDWLSLKEMLGCDVTDPAVHALFVPATGKRRDQGILWLEQAASMLAKTRDHPVQNVPLEHLGSSFELAVWRAINGIPRGLTWTYKRLAEAVGHPKAIRAVATACGRNPIALLVPCHRVVRSDGALGGYRWGISRKQQILAIEGAGD